LWADASSIRFKISPHDDLKGIVGGNWDLDRRFPLSEAVKHRSIAQRYRDGLPWEETDLFRDIYARRIKTEPIRGEATMEGLLEQYRVDDLFDKLRRKGFQDCHPLPVFLIGRDGEVFIGNQGNHRLAMAQVLGLQRIAGDVICRHKCWKESTATIRG
jgi:hypothetical protein